MRFRLLPLLTVCAVLGLRLAPAQESLPRGTIVGTVRWTGPVPAPMTIMVTDGTTIQHSDLVVDVKTKGLRDVVAILEDAPIQPKLKDAKPALMDQQNWIFIPRVVAVQSGQPVRFENSDAVNHSVLATSTLPENQLNSVAGPGSPILHTFLPQKRPVMIGCSLHPWMRAWVYVVQHPWFGVSDSQGKFHIDKVPPGKYTLLLVHPDTNRQERRTIDVVAGKTAELTVDLHKTK